MNSRELEPTGQFKRDWKREQRGRHRRTLVADFLDALAYLVTDENLPDRYHDHQLAGEWRDCRDCHLRPNLVLIYSKPDEETLRLIRIGSHSELGL